MAQIAILVSFLRVPPFHFLRFCANCANRANCYFSDFLKAIFEGEMDLRDLRILVFLRKSRKLRKLQF